MSDSYTVLVTGATGKQGGATARALLKTGRRVRALTRNPDSPAAAELAEMGATVLAGDFGDPASLQAALDGADGMFVMTTPFEGGAEAEISQGKALADAAKAAGIGHLVYTSVAGADKDTGVPHFDSKYAVEQYLDEIDVPHTILAPVYFMENIYFPDTLGGIRQGVYATPLPADRKLQQVAVTDIGAFAALAFHYRERFLHRRIELAGGELTGQHVAMALSVVTGEEVRYEQIPMETIRAASEDMALMYEWFISKGYDVDVMHLRSKYSMLHWHGYADWLAEQDLSVFGG